MRRNSQTTLPTPCSQGERFLRVLPPVTVNVRPASSADAADMLTSYRTSRDDAQAMSLPAGETSELSLIFG